MDQANSPLGLQLLLAAGARPDRHCYGTVPLGIAAIYGFAETVDALLLGGAKVDGVPGPDDLPDDPADPILRRETPLLLAANTGRTDMCRRLVRFRPRGCVCVFLMCGDRWPRAPTCMLPCRAVTRRCAVP